MRHRPFGVSAEKFGEGAGRPGSPGAGIELPFRRDRPPRVVVFHTPAGCRPFSGLADSRTGPCGPGQGGTCGRMARSGPAQKARGEQADAIHRRPQGPPRYASPGLHRSTTARRHREAWIRRPPHRRDGADYGAGSSCGGEIAGFFCDFVRDHMFNMTKSSVSQGIPSTPTPCIPRRRGPRLCPHRRSLTERRLAQPASLSLKPGSPPSRGCTDGGGVPASRRCTDGATGEESASKRCGILIPLLNSCFLSI